MAVAREEAAVAQVLDLYGVGVDTHSKFIQVCVLINKDNEVQRHEREFTTDWTDLKAAAEWIRVTIGEAYDRPGKFHFTIESTGTYHCPVLRAFDGWPRVVNPLLAGGSRRKTDVLDARLLAHHDITGMWPESFIPGDDVNQLRVLLRERRAWLRRRLQMHIPGASSW